MRRVLAGICVVLAGCMAGDGGAGARAATLDGVTLRPFAHAGTTYAVGHGRAVPVYMMAERAGQDAGDPAMVWVETDSGQRRPGVVLAGPTDFATAEAVARAWCTARGRRARAEATGTHYVPGSNEWWFPDLC
ncbi:hypothetical protein [Phaeovulum vinaykumarii]|uniref:Lipoprotein n=1 Tax=Phaeovulum vinaykumarii TaxID=407234 RepID=A0A1N7JRR4_9RHOB|nr:hypothetical protein [Phaeovulum vinaykumarii]SIS51926.1 hypothetical protein SAMN05421795_101269 [Phaeovulum vinaykumarii]SOB90968.1 hypothetical protein SAMN05878426_101269 [Phaeovulum vinaykumarii]